MLLRATPEDFRVDEIPLYPPAGEGEHTFVLVEKRERTTEEVARELARAELHRYMALDNYRRCWLGLGFDESDLADGGSDRFLDAMVVSGGVDAIQGRIDEHFDAGATHVCIQPVHPAGDLEAAKRTLEALAPG